MASKKSISRFIIMNLMIAVMLICISAYSTEASSAKSIINACNSQNSVERREALNSLDDFLPEDGQETPQWIADLLSKALKDKSPVVVAEAAFQIGKFNLLQFNTDLITLYKEAENRFGASGYERRVRYSVIPALGSIGNKQAKTLITELLTNDNASAMGKFLLEAIKNSNDPVFLNVLKAYKNKMANYVNIAKAKGDNPLLYSRKLSYMQYAAEIEKVLLSKGGK